ncbi:MAG: GLUG motif-containing protein, partial [Anaerohalosphaeraceae bacterium]
LVGANGGGTINNCFATGNIICFSTTTSYAGGLVGQNITGTIHNCHNACDVAGQSIIGGVVGKLNSGIIRNCYNTGKVTGDNDVGGLAGSVGVDVVEIDKCYNTGNITGKDNVGGLAGSVAGAIAIEIDNCYNAGNIQGQSSVGGLTGKQTAPAQSDFGIKLRSCKNTGDVIGVGTKVGGLTGRQSNSETSNCYNIGNVSGNGSVGGLVGDMEYSTINTSYSAGKVIFAVDGGGLVGNATTGVLNCFWDTQTSELSTSAGGKGRSSEQMKQSANYIAWNKPEALLWILNEGQDYPRLFWEVTPGIPLPSQLLSEFLTGAGFPSNPYQIQNAWQLNAIGLYPSEWNKTFKLMDDIDMSVYSENDFNKIGLNDKQYFSGTFNGNGYVVRNLTYIASNSEQYVGLFGYVGNSATIKNLGLENVNISSSGDYVGAVTGWQNASTLSNLYSTGIITGGKVVGGIAGYSKGTAAFCYSACNVSGVGNSGGLFGNNQGTAIKLFWDTQTSGQNTGAGTGYTAGMLGKITIEMKTIMTYISLGWDFTNEVINGENDYWRMCVDELDYPQLTTAFSNRGDFACPDGVFVEDLNHFATWWLSFNCANSNNCAGADITANGFVNLADYAVLAAYWMRGQ